MFVVREELGNNGVWDGVDDAKDTHKIGVSKVSVVYRGLIMLGLSDADFGYIIGFRRLI